MPRVPKFRLRPVGECFPFSTAERRRICKRFDLAVVVWFSPGIDGGYVPSFPLADLVRRRVETVSKDAQRSRDVVLEIDGHRHRADLELAVMLNRHRRIGGGL